MATFLDMAGLAMFTSHAPSLSKLWEHMRSQSVNCERTSPELGCRAAEETEEMQRAESSVQPTQEHGAGITGRKSCWTSHWVERGFGAPGPSSQDHRKTRMEYEHRVVTAGRWKRGWGVNGDGNI